jgi:hypothetical protein
VAAEDLERRIAALKRELAERDRLGRKVELENARLQKIVEKLEAANRSVVPPKPNMQAKRGKRSKLHARQQIEGRDSEQ